MVAGPERSRGSTSSSPASAWPARPFLYDPAFAVIIRWFHRQRANALLAATQFAGLANALFERLGWRDTPLVLAATLACLIILPHWLVLRRDPADLGLHPDGADRPPPSHALDEPKPQAAETLTAAASWAARHAAFRWYAAAFASQATAVIIAVRRIPVAHVAATMFVIQGAGIGVLLLAGHSTAGVIAFVLFVGLGFGVGTVTRPALLAQTFGVRRYATPIGLTALVTTLATAAGPLTAGLGPQPNWQLHPRPRRGGLSLRHRRSQPDPRQRQRALVTVRLTPRQLRPGGGVGAGHSNVSCARWCR